jgi:hypothetical protein
MRDKSANLAWNQITPYNMFVELLIILLNNPWLFNGNLWEVKRRWGLTGMITLGTIASLKTPRIWPEPEK